VTHALLGVVNLSTVVADSEVQPYVDAQVHQLRYHLCPAWGKTTPAVIAYKAVADIPKGGWPIVIMDDSDQQGALAYHSETPEGLDYARVFAKTLKDAGVSWTSGASHEVCEAVVDPACVTLATDGSGVAWAVEVCDPVESTSYDIDGVEMSDFVRPAWFDPQAPEGTNTRWHRNNPTEPNLKPFEIDTGGYAVFTKDLSHWDQKFGLNHPAWRREMKGDGSRTVRRIGV
jgi:hypothetical protein